MSIITIVLNICQGYFCPMAAGWWSALFWIVSVPCDPPRFISCAATRDRTLCIRCTSVCSSLFCLCVFLCQWMFEVSQGFSSMIGAGSLSETGLGLGDVDFNAVSTFRGGVLSYWRRTLRCHQTFPGFLPLFVHGRVHAPVLPRWQLGFSLLLWHRWWKLLVFILKRSNQEGEGIRYGVVQDENTTSSGADELSFVSY